jgi:hypothetical protein
MRPAHARPQGEIGQGGGLSGGGPVVALRGREVVWRAQQARSADCCPTGEAVRACGRRDSVGGAAAQTP